MRKCFFLGFKRSPRRGVHRCGDSIDFLHKGKMSDFNSTFNQTLDRKHTLYECAFTDRLSGPSVSLLFICKYIT